MIDSSVDYKNLPRPTWAEIDIDAILNNINEYKKALGNKVEIIVAAKGNGYGHGMLPIVKAINELDIYGFATGNMYEAIEMRKHGIDKQHAAFQPGPFQVPSGIQVSFFIKKQPILTDGLLFGAREET